MTRLKAPERREQLLAVATRLFAQKGYDATTTASIAEAAGITEPVLYRHFDSKLALFIEVLRGCTQLLLARWQASIVPADLASEQLRRIANTAAIITPEVQDAQRVIYGASIVIHDPSVVTCIREHVSQFTALLAEVIRAGVARGEFPKDLDVDSISWAFINIYTGYAFTQLNIPSDKMNLCFNYDLLISGLIHKAQAK